MEQKRARPCRRNREPAKEAPCQENMGTKPGLIGNGRKTILDDGALKSFAKDSALQILSVHKRTAVLSTLACPGSGCKGGHSSWTNPAPRKSVRPYGETQ